MFWLAACIVAALLLATPLLGAAQTPGAVPLPGTDSPAETVIATAPVAPESAGQHDGTASADSASVTTAPPAETNANTAAATASDTTEPPTPSGTIVPPGGASGEAAGPLAPTATMPPTSTNTDTLTPTSDTAPVTLQPGQTRQYAFTYDVTTPRTGTTIHAELRLDDGSPATGWLLQAQAGQGAPTGDSPAVDIVETVTLTPGGTFPLTITVQTPAEVTAPLTASLYLSSTTTSGSGDTELDVAAGSPVASLTVVPPVAASAPAHAPLAATPAGTAPSAVQATGPCVPTVDIGPLTFGTSTWDGSAWSPVTGSLALTIHASTASGCAGIADGWTIRAGASGMTNADGSIPASAIFYDGGGAAPTGIVPVGSDVALTTSGETIAAGGATVVDGAVWTISLMLRPPDNTPPGDYAGTVTITIAAGGQRQTGDHP